MHLERVEHSLMKKGGRGGGMCRYLLDDRGVEAVKAAVQPDALREK